MVALDLNIDGTQMLQVRREEMIAFLTDVIPAIQEMTALPLHFDNPAYEFHQDEITENILRVEFLDAHQTG